MKTRQNPELLKKCHLYSGNTSSVCYICKRQSFNKSLYAKKYPFCHHFFCIQSLLHVGIKTNTVSNTVLRYTRDKFD